MRRANIHFVGVVEWAPDGTIIGLQSWHFEGGDAPGHQYGEDGRLERICGWSLEELRIIYILWSAYRFPLPIPGDQFGPVLPNERIRRGHYLDPRP